MEAPTRAASARERQLVVAGVRINDLNSSLSMRINDLNTSVSGRIDRFENRLENRFDGLDERLRNVEVMLGKVEGRLLTIERVVLPGSEQPSE